MKNMSKGTGYLIVIVFWIITAMFLSMRTSKTCCERTVQEVYEYEGLVID